MSSSVFHLYNLKIYFIHTETKYSEKKVTFILKCLISGENFSALCKKKYFKINFSFLTCISFFKNENKLVQGKKKYWNFRGFDGCFPLRKVGIC